MQYEKKYIDVIVKIGIEEDINFPIPLQVKWDDIWYSVKLLSRPMPRVALKAGGQGLRYEVDVEGKKQYWFYDETNRFFIEVPVKE